MDWTHTLFWVLVFVVFYTYLGYAVVLYFLVRLKRIIKKERTAEITSQLPSVTLFVAAYNEKDFVDEKIHNHMSLNYPQEKITHLWVTDGSDDGTPELLQKYPQVVLLHQKERGGKIGAMNRGMKHVNTPIVIFSDANTLLSQDSVKIIVELFNDPRVGCVSGEKRISMKLKEHAASAGEGLYWKYESLLKKWDAELNSVVGAAGELFAIRTELYQDVEPDTLLDDFIISLRIAAKGYTIQYSADAYAVESSSASVKEELKRKIRISAGGLQSIVRLRKLLNPFRYGLLSFQYISHRVLRWTLAPLSLPLIFILNLIIVVMNWSQPGLYHLLMALQLLFYLLAAIGYVLESKHLRLKLLFVPYYFTIMNYSVFLGLRRLIKGKQSVNWDRALRSK